MNRRFVGIVAIVVGAVTVMLPSAAMAEDETSAIAASTGTGYSSASTTAEQDEACVASLRDQWTTALPDASIDDPEFQEAVSAVCVYSANVTVGAESEVTSGAAFTTDELQVEAADGTTLEQAITASTVYTRSWSHSMKSWLTIAGGVPVWREKHYGASYYDKNGRVWALRNKAACNCYGYSVVRDLWTEKRYDLIRAGGPALSNWDAFSVHYVAKGIPLSKSYHQHVNVYADGRAYYYTSA